jgi:NarL family two-component system sensor histidine kinase LiaS
VQEALHNVARHSGTREARVSLVSDAASIALEVADSGVGFNPGGHPYGSLGLAGMQERVTYLKGRLVIDAFPGGGTRISVRIPLEAAAIVSTRTSTQSSEAASSA